MRYSPEGADDMHDCVVMIYQSCGLDKKILVPKNEDFLAGMAGFEPTDARVKVWCLTAWRHPNIARKTAQLLYNKYLKDAIGK